MVFMGKNIVEKIIEKYIVDRRKKKIGMKIDQTLTQDATSARIFQFEALDAPEVKTELPVSYMDHNMVQTDFRNPDEHAYLQSITSKAFL